MSNSRHRPPHGDIKIQELIKLGHYDEAQRYTDENIEFYREKIEHQQELYLDAQMAKMNVQPSKDVQLAIADPSRRVTINQLDFMNRQED